MGVFARIIIIEIIVDAWVTYLIGSFYDFFDIVSNLIDVAIVCLDSMKLALHFSLEEFIKRFPEILTDEEHRHFWHFAFLH